MSRVVLYDGPLNRLLKSPVGPVAQFVQKKAGQIHSHAFNNISTLTVKRTGDLLGSLRMIPFDGADGHHVAVGADATHTHGKSGAFPYAKALETGSEPTHGRADALQERPLRLYGARRAPVWLQAEVVVNGRHRHSARDRATPADVQR